MAGSNSSSRRTQSRQRRRQLERRDVLSNGTLRMGSGIREERTEIRRSPEGATFTRKQVWDIPTTDA